MEFLQGLWLPASLSGSNGFDPGLFGERFVLQNVPMGQNFVRLYLFPVINIIQPVLCIQLRSVPSIMAAY
jgi:hypothetical protein